MVLDGGVKVVKSADQAKEVAQKILGNVLVTHQSGSEGKEVRTLLVEQGCDIKKEYYLGLVLDRANSRVTIMASTEGGMDIEAVAAKTPEKILKVAIDPAVGFQAYQGRKLGFSLGFSADMVSKFVKFCTALYKVYVETDASVVEINPLVLTGSGDLLALDGKINFDDNALFRHADLVELRDLNEEDPQEIEAGQHELSYIALDGSIGCMVNGAGLAMATLDIIKEFGGEPANFLDVGGGASAEKVTAAFKIILKDPKVKAILVNIFGGIMKCDVIATGIVSAVKEVGLKLPLVVRLQGTNVDLGKKILADSGLTIISADTMSEAAQKVVETIH
jgi:succinyl-CoA synthetase beta subunit